MATLKPGMEITVRILQLNEEGDGLANYNGHVIFIQDVLPHRTVKATVTKVVGKMVYAEATEMLQEEYTEDQNETEDNQPNE